MRRKWLPILPSQRLMFHRSTAQILAWKSNLQREENQSTRRKTLGVRLRSTNLICQVLFASFEVERDRQVLFVKSYSLHSKWNAIDKSYLLERSDNLTSCVEKISWMTVRLSTFYLIYYKHYIIITTDNYLHSYGDRKIIMQLFRNCLD